MPISERAAAAVLLPLTGGAAAAVVYVAIGLALAPIPTSGPVVVRTPAPVVSAEVPYPAITVSPIPLEIP